MFVLAAGTAPARAQPGHGGPRRPGLERLAQVVQRRLQLTDEQATRLRAVTARFAAERQTLFGREREARRAVREQVRRGAAGDQDRVRTALDALVAVQQRRAALVADEQRELSAFLTPIQRAQYLGMQERAFRAAQRLRRARDDGPAPHER